MLGRISSWAGLMSTFSSLPARQSSLSYRQKMMLMFFYELKIKISLQFSIIKVHLKRYTFFSQPSFQAMEKFTAAIFFFQVKKKETFRAFLDLRAAERPLFWSDDCAAARSLLPCYHTFSWSALYPLSSHRILVKPMPSYPAFISLSFHMPM